MKNVHTRSGKIAYDEQGTGTPIVLIHANAGDHRNFESIIPTLSQKYRTLAIDLPGFGKSEACQPPQNTSSATMADALDAFIDLVNPEKAIFIGNSVGGFAAARFAITHPDRVRGLILVDTGGFTAHTIFTRLFCRVKGSETVTRLFDTQFARSYLKRRNSFVTAVIALTDHYRRIPVCVAVNAALWRKFADPESDLRPRAAQIQAPTLLVWGRYDPVLRLADGQTAESLIPQARLVVMETGHMPFAEDPAGFLRTITPFLETL